MSPLAVVETRAEMPERRRRDQDWSTVVARHTRDDWPPPEWLASVTAHTEDGPLVSRAA